MQNFPTINYTFSFKVPIPDPIILFLKLFKAKFKNLYVKALDKDPFVFNVSLINSALSLFIIFFHNRLVKFYFYNYHLKNIQIKKPMNNEILIFS